MVLSGIDLRVLVHEIKNTVEKSWIVNIYELPGHLFIFKLRQPGVGLRFLLVEPGKRIHLTTFNREMPKEPTNFARSLRSHLRNTMINWIEQQDMDRIVKLNIGPEPGYTLVIELFGQGNIILVNPQNKIVTAMRFRKMRDRDIHPGREFRDMPPQDRDIIRDGTQGLEAVLQSNPKLIPALNQWLGLGPYYSKYVLRELDISKKNSEELTNEEKESIIEYCEQLKNRLIEHHYHPVVYLDADQREVESETTSLDYDSQWSDESLLFKPEDVVKILPWSQPVEDEDDLEILEIDNLWEAYDIFYSSQESQDIFEGESEELDSHLEKLQTQLEEQEKHRERLLTMAEIYRKNADALYNNFQATDELISTVYNAKKNNMDWSIIEEKLELGKQKGIKSAQIFDKIEPYKAKMYLSLPYEGENVGVTVDFRKSLTDNANEYYQDAKKAEKKARGAADAISRTKERIATANDEVAEKIRSQREKIIILKRRKHWYEKFHWAITPNETLIIGGYDAGSNEKLVKRYLDPDDLFVHADLQGASAVVIKSQGSSISDTDRRIAGQMAVTYSSGWKAKLPMADAFIVDSDQVSLTPPSGEYLPKGSFMIYGEKSYENNLSLELCIGIVLERHWARVIYGPEECMQNADMWVKLTPGTESRGSLAKSVLNRFGSMADDITKQKIDALDNGEVAWYIPGDSKIIEYRNNLK